MLAQARAAELRGELAQAAALFAQAGRLDEASRVMLIRGDGEADPAARLPSLQPGGGDGTRGR